MKTTLKYLITIAIIIGIIFGVRAIILNKNQNLNVYNTLSQERLDKINNQKMQQSVSGMSKYYNDNKSSNNIPAEIKQSWESGEMHFYLTIYADCDNYLSSLKPLVALSSNSNDYHNSINQALDKTYDSLKAQNETASQLNNYLNGGNVEESNLNFYYNALVNSVKQTTKNYSNLLKSISDFIYNNVYNRTTTNIDFVKAYVKINMANCTIDNLELLSDYSKLSVNSNNINEEFMLKFNQCNNINNLLSATNKIEFLEQANNESYNYIAKVLFNVEVGGN